MRTPENSCTACSPSTLRCRMQLQLTLNNLPHLHFADKAFSFALNYQKCFPKAPGSASKSFYRQKIEAQWTTGENEEKGRYEGKRGRNDQQDSRGGRSHAASLQRRNGMALNLQEQGQILFVSMFLRKCMWSIILTS